MKSPLRRSPWLSHLYLLPLVVLVLSAVPLRGVAGGRVKAPERASFSKAQVLYLAFSKSVARAFERSGRFIAIAFQTEQRACWEMLR